MRNQKGFTLIELMIAVAVVAILVCIVFSVTSGVGDGDRVGVVTKFSNKGIVWKTWEGELILGGQGTVTKSVWYFTVSNPELVTKVQNAIETQETVRLTYHENMISRPWLGSTKYFIEAVNPVKAVTPKKAPE